jgi:hypothetical protein
MKAIYSSPAATEKAFYKAFEGNDVDAMMACTGTAERYRVYFCRAANDCSAGRPSEMARNNCSQTTGSSVSSSVNYQRSPANNFPCTYSTKIFTLRTAPQPAVIVTNIYRFNGSGWSMMLHHAALTATHAHHETTRRKGREQFFNSLK